MKHKFQRLKVDMNITDIPIVCYKFLLVVVTLFLVGTWIKRYDLDEDISVVELKSYLDSVNDVFPVLSMCLEQKFPDDLFRNYGNDILGSNYEKYLNGEYFDPNMENIVYSDVSTNITRYIIQIRGVFVNGTRIIDPIPNIYWKKPYYTYSWNCWGRFVKCFGVEIIHPNISRLDIFMKRDIFQNLTRPQSGSFAILFHYPHQFLTSYSTVIREWPKRNETENFWMGFYVKGLHASAHRYKRNRANCIEDWKNYDKVMLKRHIERVGCKIPDQPINGTVCKNKGQMKKARLDLRIKKGSIPPCREMDWIDVQYGETDKERMVKPGEKDYNWFAVTLEIRRPNYQLTVYKKEIDFQSLVGYVGGYIGIFTGFALFHAPDIVRDMTLQAKRIIFRH